MLVTLWAIFPSPLMVGGDLTKADDWTTSLLTNPEVIAVDQHSTGNHPVIANKSTVVWVAKSTTDEASYLAIFNLTTANQKLSYSWKELELPAAKYRVQDLWEHKDLGEPESVSVTLPPHGSVLLKIVPAP